MHFEKTPLWLHRRFVRYSEPKSEMRSKIENGTDVEIVTIYNVWLEDTEMKESHSYIHAKDCAKNIKM